ncbi:uncharacterized protein LOC115628115 [Scaptodrosophila lebanonensis]|uniref:Uncharacterized protein LOC115628115 n=1 Tax=Drosophila lebanonensis TaxID=7225 RepID=A0A6J2TXU4_DROLE|nr:uncharacterized protein LOC115628115 [Scaptodrosophila lebanonensis]
MLLKCPGYDEQVVQVEENVVPQTLGNHLIHHAAKALRRIAQPKRHGLKLVQRPSWYGKRGILPAFPIQFDLPKRMLHIQAADVNCVLHSAQNRFNALEWASLPKSLSCSMDSHLAQSPLAEASRRLLQTTASALLATLDKSALLLAVLPLPTECGAAPRASYPDHAPRRT